MRREASSNGEPWFIAEGYLFTEAAGERLCVCRGICGVGRGRPAVDLASRRAERLGWVITEVRAAS